MSELPEKLARIVDFLDSVDERQERIQILIDLSRRFRPVPDRVAARPYPDTCRAPACDSQAYVFAEDLEDGTLKLHFAVENPQGITAMALAVILDEALSGEPLDRVAGVPPEVIHRIFGEDLSMGKTMGLMGMVNLVRAEAKRRMESRSRA